MQISKSTTSYWNTSPGKQIQQQMHYLDHPTPIMGDNDNKNITIFPSSQVRAAKTIQGRTIVPNIKDVKRAIVGQAHNGPTAGHLGRDETLRKVQQHFWWPGMKTWIMEYIRGCATCQQAKILTHRNVPPPITSLPKKGHSPFKQLPWT
jgi:hypothetical protein